MEFMKWYLTINFAGAVCMMIYSNSRQAHEKYSDLFHERWSVMSLQGKIILNLVCFIFNFATFIPFFITKLIKKWWPV